MSKFVIRPVKSGLKFDLKAANGQVILTSEVYTTAAACRKGIASVVKNAPLAKVENQTEKGYAVLTNPKFEMYQDKAGAYRFRLKARNGEIIAVSESYTARAGCLNGIESVQKNAMDAEIMEK
ncbi:MAG: YegP family protein [Oscillospiraceae bacterium]|nr:YegP family protein [Oscillospiraceae bacterium]